MACCASDRRCKRLQKRLYSILLWLWLTVEFAFSQQMQDHENDEWTTTSVKSSEIISQSRGTVHSGIDYKSKLQQYWINTEYLLLSIDRYAIPSLATTSSIGTASANAGVLDFPTTSTLLDSEYGRSIQSGFRIGVGGWLNQSNDVGFEINYLGLPSQAERSTFDSNQYAILARPVFDSVSGTEAASLVSYPDVLRGNLAVTGSSDLQFVDVLVRKRWARGVNSHIDLLTGFQYAGLHEKLSIDQFSQYVAGQGPILVGTSKLISDEFETRNQFYGGLFGMEYRERVGWSLVSIRPGLAFGMNETNIAIRGNTTNTVPNAGTANFEGGVLAQSTNAGSYADRKMTVIPELTVGLQTYLYSNLHLSVGYNLRYWNNAVRPGPQIDRTVSQFPPEMPSGDRHPIFSFQKEGVLIHGLQMGLVFNF